MTATSTTFERFRLQTQVDESYISKPHCIEFETTGTKKTAYMNYYRPKNKVRPAERNAVDF